MLHKIQCVFDGNFLAPRFIISFRLVKYYWDLRNIFIWQGEDCTKYMEENSYIGTHIIKHLKSALT